MRELIETKAELIHYLTTKPVASKEPPKSVFVTTKLRRLVLTDEMQGKFIHNGLVKRFDFKNEGGGVYSVSIVSLGCGESDNA